MSDHTPTTTPVKQCPKCKEWKPLSFDYFHKGTGKGGFQSRCKTCRSEWNRRNTPPAPYVEPGHKRCPRCEEIKPATIKYFARHESTRDGFHGHCKACNSRYYFDNKARINEANNSLYYKNKPQRAAYSRRYYLKNRTKVIERSTRYNAENKERRSEWQRSDYAANKEKHLVIHNRHRALKRNAEGHHTAADIVLQYKRQKGRCYYCSVKVGKTYHVDHIVPLSRGGSNWPENLVIACPTCNMSKHDKMPHEWGGSNRLL